jgi:hypothetical protein
MSKIIQVIVSPKGETKIETMGFTGSSCQEASRALEQALGAKTEETLTGEYYATSNEQTTELNN